MNIFAVSNDPSECARALDDVRLRKMIVETAQLLSTALHEWGHPAAEHVYKPTHRNHPCAVWVRESWENYTWAYNLLLNLLSEYTTRAGKSHKTAEVKSVLKEPLLDRRNAASPWNHSPFPNCTPYKDWETHEAYRQTLRDKWKEDAVKQRPPTWTNRKAPTWAEEEVCT